MLRVFRPRRGLELVAGHPAPALADVARRLGVPPHEIADARHGRHGTVIVEGRDGHRFRLAGDGRVFFDCEGHTHDSNRLPTWQGPSSLEEGGRADQGGPEHTTPLDDEGRRRYETVVSWALDVLAEPERAAHHTAVWAAEHPVVAGLRPEHAEHELAAALDTLARGTPAEG